MGKDYSFKYTKKNSNYIFNLFLFFYLIFGFYLSVNTGISTDEFVEQKNWRLNFGAIKDFFGNNDDGYFNLLEYEWKFHGIGFHYFSQIYLLLVGLIVKFEKFPEEISRVLLNHSLIFFTFFLSGIFAKKL